MAPTQKSKTRSRLFAVLRIVATLGILGFVAANLSWRDAIVWTGDGGTVHEVPGELEGDWKLDSVAFVPAEDAEAHASWDAAAREAIAGRERLALERDERRFGAGTVDWRPGMPTTFRDMDPMGIVQAMACFIVGFLIVVTRWWRLLALAGCPTSWFNALRLTFLGMFFNLVMPGLTGGDLVKAFIVANENPGRRPDALVSVVVDRLLGLGSLALLAAAVIVVSGSTFAELRTPVLGLIAVGLVALFLFANPRLRRALRLKELAAKLPLGEKLQAVDRAALLYFRHPVEVGLAVVLSLLNHLAIIVGVFALGRAFGVEESAIDFREYLVVVPVANMLSAVPVFPGGWGIGEAAFAQLFVMMGGVASLGVAVSVTFRLSQLAFGLVGGAFLLAPGAKAEVREAEGVDAAVP